MAEICGDNRFELINKYKRELIEATNIETAPDEMAVLDDILFRFWQMGWLDKLEQPEHPKGKWIPVTYIYKTTKDEFPYMHIEWVDSTELDEIDGLRCSECGTVYDFTEARNWCSECGADMRGDMDEAY